MGEFSNLVWIIKKEKIVGSIFLPFLIKLNPLKAGFIRKDVHCFLPPSFLLM